MFFVKCLVEDKNLPTVLHRLAGIALNVLPVPIANAKRYKKGKLETNGEALHDLVYNKIKNRKYISTKGVSDLISQLGQNKTSTSTVIKELKKRDLLQSTSKGKYRLSQLRSE